MTLSDVARKLGLKPFTSSASLDREVEGAYVGDLLSDVMANAKEGCVWITAQVHPNIVAVAALKDLCGIILAAGRTPDPETVQKAESEGVPILGGDESSFELAGRLYELGVRG